MSAAAKVVCPNCKLENRRGETRCAGCGNVLPKFLAGLPRVALPAVPPPDDATPAVASTRVDTDETQSLDASSLREQLAKGPPPPAPVAEPPAPSANAVAWLHCEPLPPIPLVPGEEITIGRKGARLLLAHTEVSRHHATIKVAGADQIQLVDNGSANGTYVNGKRIAAHALRVGDLVKIGPYALEVWQVKDLPVEDPEQTSAVPLAAEPTFSGKLGPMTLSEVLDAIAARHRTGTLQVTDRQQRGRIRFADGRVIEAEWGAHRAEAAVNEMSKLAFGIFAFSEG